MQKICATYNICARAQYERKCSMNANARRARGLVLPDAVATIVFSTNIGAETSAIYLTLNDEPAHVTNNSVRERPKHVYIRALRCVCIS